MIPERSVRGPLVWRLPFCLLHTLVTVLQWRVVQLYAETRREIESEYSPEVIALAHIHLQRPAGLLPFAWFMTALAAYWWWRVIETAEE